MASPKSQTSIKILLKKSAGQLPPEELDDLLALALHKNKEYIYKNPDKNLTRSSIRAFKKLLDKRLQGWSLAYLRGYKEFFGLKFLVSKDTLLPRPESELIVEEALKFIKKNHRVLDVGTGTGCLVLSLAKNFPGAQYLATDISNKALKTAKTNARKLDLKNKVAFFKSNLLKNVPAQKFDIVIANLPYLRPDQLKEPSIKKEPPLALWGGPDGLIYYQELLKQLPDFLNKKYLLLLEIDPAQKEAIKKTVEQLLPTAKLKFLSDLSNNIRVIKITH